VNYFIYIFIIIFTQLIYLKIARKYNIVDRPNSRSSHDDDIIRGSGIIYPISLLLWFLSNGYYLKYFIIGLLLVSIISFLDDVFDLKQIYRLSIHLISTFFIFYQLGLLEIPLYLIVITVILIIGWLNAFNFMDGINGITIFYTLVNLFTLYFVNADYNFIDEQIIIYTIIPVVLFSFLNLRTKAVAFGGDVGSFSLSFILAFMMISLILKTGNISYILFFSVYGIDTVFTIFERLYKKENIFIAHRNHLFQLLSNEMKFHFLKVSMLYSIIQLIINIMLILYIIPNENSIVLSSLILMLMSSAYLFIKYKIKLKLLI
tara:strand:+ start:2380 stop:3333 length:954 start_codon:yes stop_codon:yes gene_type:complete